MLPRLVIGNGITHFGRISGFVMGWVVAGSAPGQYLFNLCFDLFEGYWGASILTAVRVLMLLLLSPFANRPEARE